VSGGPYVLVNGTLFSSTLNALTRDPGVPEVPLNRTEWNEQRDVPVWTGTRAAGTFAGNDCAVWNSAIDANGDFGLSSSMTSTWTLSETRACSSQAAIYCFQDDCPGVAEVDFLTDRSNCGRCGNVCPVACERGVCVER